jgi:hypothetical protein
VPNRRLGQLLQTAARTVTRIIMKFDLPVVPFTVPPSPRTAGNEYVWHCRILEHEEHDNDAAAGGPLASTGSAGQQAGFPGPGTNDQRSVEGKPRHCGAFFLRMILSQPPL